MTVLAHILPNNVIPEPAQWVAITLMACGGLAVLRRRGRWRDRVGWSVFGLGTAAILGFVGIAMFAPQPPGYALSLMLTPRGGSSFGVRVCARYPSGAPTHTPANGDVLAVLVDGKQVAYSSVGEFVVPAAPGQHLVRVELLANTHREFDPVVAAQASVNVTPEGVTETATAVCPGG